jgi:hypothetical protein
MPLIDTDYLIFGIIGAVGMVAGFLLMINEPAGSAFNTAGAVLLIGGGGLALLGIYRYLSSAPRPGPPPVIPRLRPASITPAYVAIALKRAGRRPEEFGIAGEAR